MLAPPALPLAGQAGLVPNAWVGSAVFLLSGRDWPRYLLGCSLAPLSTTPFQLFTVPGGATGEPTLAENGFCERRAEGCGHPEPGPPPLRLPSEVLPSLGK